MITLLIALFMVLFAISSVNTTKLEVLSKSLQEAFSGKVLPGGPATMDSGSSDATEKPAPEPPMPAMMPLEQAAAQQSSSNASAPAQAEQAAKEQEDFEKLKRRIDAIVEREGLKGRVQTEIRRRGLVVRLLTDQRLLRLGPGRAQGAVADHVLDSLGNVLAGEREHPVVVEGYTDSQPVQRGGQYPTNWELSGARAASVVRAFVGERGAHRTASRWRVTRSSTPSRRNATPDGRARNRRVEVDPRPASTAAQEGPTMKKKLMILVPVLLIALGGVYKFVLSKPEVEAKPHVEGTVYVLGKEFLVNLADGRFAKLTVALVLDPHDTSTVPAGGGHGAAPKPPEGFGDDGPGGRRARHRHRRAHRRQGRRPHPPGRSRQAQEEDPQEDPQVDRCPR